MVVTCCHPKFDEVCLKPAVRVGVFTSIGGSPGFPKASVPLKGVNATWLLGLILSIKIMTFSMDTSPNPIRFLQQNMQHMLNSLLLEFSHIPLIFGGIFEVDDFRNFPFGGRCEFPAKYLTLLDFNHMFPLPPRVE